MKTKEELKIYFKGNNKPKQENFWEFQDSYWHKLDEKVASDSIDAIQKPIINMLDNNMLMLPGISLTIPSNVKKIGEKAFMYTGNTSAINKIYLNEGLEEIGPYGFNGHPITKVKTPSTLKIIGEAAFSYYNFEEITLNEGLKVIDKFAFFTFMYPPLTDLYIPSSVTFVGEKAFGIPTLASVSAPAGLDLSISGIPSTAVITYR